MTRIIGFDLGQPPKTSIVTFKRLNNGLIVVLKIESENELKPQGSYEDWKKKNKVIKK